MEEIQTLLAAAGVFASTNVDDILILAAFFADPAIRTRAIVAGQFLGIGALVLASVAVAWAAFSVPAHWLAWLGVVPLLLGVKALLALRGEKDTGAEADEEEHGLEREGRSQLHAVALVTVANGADNLGAYIPLFANDRGIIATYAVVFAILTAAWCWAGYVIARHPLWGGWVRRYGRWLLPIALIAIGLHILLDVRL